MPGGDSAKYYAKSVNVRRTLTTLICVVSFQAVLLFSIVTYLLHSNIEDENGHSRLMGPSSFLAERPQASLSLAKRKLRGNDDRDDNKEEQGREQDRE